MTNINLHYSVDTLDTLPEDLKQFIRPCDRVYYGRYAYKVSFVTPDIPSHILMDKYGYDSEVERERYFRDQLFEYVAIPRYKDNSNCPKYLEENVIHKQRSGGLANDVHSLYFKSFNDLKTTVDKFRDNLYSIEGPINKVHLDLLLSNNYRCEVRPSKWYKKYDYRVSMFMPYKMNLKYTVQEKVGQKLEILTYLKDNISNDSLRFTGSSYDRTTSNFLEFFTESEQFDLAYPFLSMMYNDWRIIVTKAYII
jgi:hypothetical protein